MKSRELDEEVFETCSRSLSHVGLATEGCGGLALKRWLITRKPWRAPGGSGIRVPRIGVTER